mmetsp:Transcript_48749/g.115830  ORF Transcript_48749/g.115830 Transcript_48749/m.115830 type:complete len:130 (+) Transcript_48749:1641-2030(+)
MVVALGRRGFMDDAAGTATDEGCSTWKPLNVEAPVTRWLPPLGTAALPPPQRTTFGGGVSATTACATALGAAAVAAEGWYGGALAWKITLCCAAFPPPRTGGWNVMALSENKQAFAAQDTRTLGSLTLP